MTSGILFFHCLLEQSNYYFLTHFCSEKQNRFRDLLGAWNRATLEFNLFDLGCDILFISVLQKNSTSAITCPKHRQVETNIAIIQQDKLGCIHASLFHWKVLKRSRWRSVRLVGGASCQDLHWQVKSGGVAPSSSALSTVWLWRPCPFFLVLKIHQKNMLICKSDNRGWPANSVDRKESSEIERPAVRTQDWRLLLR